MREGRTASRVIAVLMAILLAGAIARPADAAAPDDDTEAVATGARVEGDGERTRFVIDVAKAVEFGTFVLPDPRRVIIDLANVRFDLSPDAGRKGAGLVTAWRYGQFAQGQARIVLDVDGPVSVEHAFYLPPVADQPGHLVVDLVSASETDFQAAVKTSRGRSAGAEPALATPTEPVGGSKPVVVLDPGHGGVDPGAVGEGGVFEKDVVLTFASELKKKLEATDDVEVRMTRDDDRFLSLRQRVEVARGYGADLFVSIHADSAPQDYVRGATVYTLSERPSDAQAAAIAARENRSDVLAGIEVDETTDEVTDILIDLARRETKVFSHHFAEDAIQQLGTAVLMHKNPHRSARFRVLKAHDIPSVLIELGYLSNAHDEQLLTDPSWRDRASDALSAAVERFFGPRLAQGKGDTVPQ
ncbi:N-acetylmuramoyl-L-alanine amidase [Amorphus sp. 3PC139-8]|uniref:N-acetylmuramoyl-L-alanine amidase n=1 Tax=Amorphus sp. 3PC139-8 TaxID=2735676 RepID=UPI00345DB696